MATWQWSGDIEIGANSQRLVTGTGDPEGHVTAPIGSVYFRADGGSNHAVYIKEAGTGNTGWTAIGASGTTITLRNNTIANSLQNILDLTDGNGMSIVDLGSGQLQINGPTFKHDGATNSFQKILDIRSGTSIAVADIGGGRITISALPQVAIQVNSVATASQSTLNFVASTNMTITDMGSGQISFAATSGSAPAGTSDNFTTGTLAATAVESSFRHLGKTGTAIKVVVSSAARVRFYSSSAARDADVSRSYQIPPTPGTEHGVMMDLYLDGIIAPLTWYLAPPVVFSNGDTLRTDKIYYNVTNIGSTPQAISVTTSYVVEET